MNPDEKPCTEPRWNRVQHARALAKATPASTIRYTDGSTAVYVRKGDYTAEALIECGNEPQARAMEARINRRAAKQAHR